MNVKKANLEDVVVDHEERITKLEKNQEEVVNQYLRLENTVLQGNKRQEELLGKLIDHHFDFKKTKWSTIIGMFTGGGAVFAVIQWVFSKL